MLKFAAGFVVGFAALLALILIFSEPIESPPAVAVQAQPLASQQLPDAPQPTAQQLPTPQATAQLTGPSYDAVCEADTNNMTDPQIAQYAERWIGQRFGGWQGWVYDVTSRSDRTYNLEIAMEARGMFWSRNIVVENIPTNLATSLNVEQLISFSGRVDRVETSFEVMCNPVYVEDFALLSPG